MSNHSVAGKSWIIESNISGKTAHKRKFVYLVSKRIFDIVISCAALPVFLGLCAVVLILNIFWNPGPLIFRQERMGRDQRKFVMIKFRTMLPDDNNVKRGPFDSLEEWRITPFGQWMRKTRLDEVPQILNVLVGDMSLIGPRPEVFDFAKTYLKEVPGYNLRGTVRPGITGYAQVKQGYTDTEAAVRTKIKLDTFYVQNMNWSLDLNVLLRTVLIVCTSHGAR